MSKIQIGLILGFVCAAAGLLLQWQAPALATRWESLGPTAWGGETSPELKNFYQLSGLALLAFGMVVLVLTFYRWLTGGALAHR